MLCYRIGTERRARTTSVATAAAAQFESSGPLTVSQNVPPELRGDVPSTAGRGMASVPLAIWTDNVLEVAHDTGWGA